MGMRLIIIVWIIALVALRRARLLELNKYCCPVNESTGQNCFLGCRVTLKAIRE